MSKHKTNSRDFNVESYDLGESAGMQLGVIMGFLFAFFLFLIYQIYLL
ncbi:hypothetical protein [Leeuwenhoekiella sp. MAR_2009_132]|nr:hypothetical protein [Leeuwenhoekiella sp. MAR_2009_132]